MVKQFLIECKLMRKHRQADVDEVPLTYGIKCCLQGNLGLIALPVVLCVFDVQRLPRWWRRRCCAFIAGVVQSAAGLPFSSSSRALVRFPLKFHLHEARGNIVWHLAPCLPQLELRRQGEEAGILSDKEVRSV